MLGMAAVLLSTVATAQCTRDTDCKGNRICEEGTCVESDVPVVAPAPVVLSAPDPSRLFQLERIDAELRDLRADLNNATLMGPIVKLILGTLVAAGAATFFAIAPAQTDPNVHGNDIVFGVIGTAVASGILIWGAVQLAIRLNTRSTLPPRIRELESKMEAGGGDY